MPNIIIILIWTVVALLLILISSFLIWSILWIPIKKRETLDKTLSNEKQELSKIQAQKGVEWESYIRLSDEHSKMQNALLEIKEREQKLKESVAKLQVYNDNLKNVNSELKKQGNTNN